MFEALGEMDKKIRQVEAKVHDRDFEEDDNLGTGMFQVTMETKNTIAFLMLLVKGFTSKDPL